MYYDTPFLALYIVNNLDLPFLSIFVGREKSNVQDITFMKEYEFDKTFFNEMSQTYLLFRLESKTKGNEIIKVKLNKEDESKIKKIFFSVYYYQKRPSDEEAYYRMNHTNTTGDMNYENSTDDKYNIYKLNYTKVGDIEHFTIFVSLFTDHISYVSIYFGPENPEEEIKPDKKEEDEKKTDDSEGQHKSETEEDTKKNSKDEVNKENTIFGLPFKYFILSVVGISLIIIAIIIFCIIKKCNCCKKNDNSIDNLLEDGSALRPDN